MLRSPLSNVRNALRTMTMTSAPRVRAPPKNPLIVVVGATGTGKSQLAVHLAEKFHGEIINADAMQLYAGLPVITNKITPEETKNIPHHLLSSIPLDAETWTVGEYRREARKTIAEIRSRNNIPVLVGGTTYYVQGTVFEDQLVGNPNGTDNEGGAGREEHGAGPGNADEGDGKTDGKIQGGKAEELDTESTESLLERLREADPVMADRWHPNDRRKIKRSLEIFLTTGRPASEIYAEQEAKRAKTPPNQGQEENANDGDVTNGNRMEDGNREEEQDDVLFFWIHADHEVLKPRLDKRVDKMMEAGMLEEVWDLNKFLDEQIATGKEVDKTRGIWASIGWKEFECYVQASKRGDAAEKELETKKAEGIEQTKAATRQYAKRQVRWIKVKLMGALEERGKEWKEKLFLLDGSDLERFDEEVQGKATEVIQKFLAGEDLPQPETLSTAAERMLRVKEEDGRGNRGAFVRKVCEGCGVTTVTELGWEQHVKSRGHRSMLKAKEKKAKKLWGWKKEGSVGEGGRGAGGAADLRGGRGRT